MALRRRKAQHGEGRPSYLLEKQEMPMLRGVNGRFLCTIPTRYVDEKGDLRRIFWLGCTPLEVSCADWLLVSRVQL